MSVLVYPDCPTDCASSLPIVSFNDCAPELKYAEIEQIFIARADADEFSDINDLNEWNTRLGSDNSDKDHINALTVKAEFPEPEVNEIEGTADRRYIGIRRYSINGIIDENNDANYLAMLEMQCNIKFRMWFKFADGSLYGGNEGLLATFAINEVASDNRQELRVFNFSAKWTAKRAPLRSVYPLA